MNHHSVAYEPRTEAISPVATLPEQQPTNEQTILVDKIRKIDDEIQITDMQIARLKKQKAQLEQAASIYLKKNHLNRHLISSSSSSSEHDENFNTTTSSLADTKQLSIAKLVYRENRAKAQKAHAKFDLQILPIYNQPSDNAIYHLNASKFNNSFKTSLIAYFKEKLQQRLKLEEQVSSEYDRRMEKWLKGIEQEDLQASKRIRDAKTREFFEKQFPELKKARESGERFSRVGQRVARSDAELDELLDGITEREDQDKKIKSYAVIPPMLEEMRSRKPKFLNENGFVKDILAEYKDYQIFNTWTDEEKDIFRENYLQHPKNFGLIASSTTRKKVTDCVQYYYLSKKSENYKQLLKRQQKRRTRSFVRPAAGNCSQETPTAAPTVETNALEDIKEEMSDEISNIKTEESNNITTTCCKCGCEFNNQYRTVTKSNHQLYGISIVAVKPGMKICYPCRFRHVEHPSFDEPSPSPSPDSVDLVIDEDDCSNQMEVVDSPLSQPAPNQPEIPENNGVLVNKGIQRTCVRDIIHQAIEMSFQIPKTTEAENPVAHPSITNFIPLHPTVVPQQQPPQAPILQHTYFHNNVDQHQNQHQHQHQEFPLDLTSFRR